MCLSPTPLRPTPREVMPPHIQGTKGYCRCRRHPSENRNLTIVTLMSCLFPRENALMRNLKLTLKPDFNGYDGDDTSWILRFWTILGIVKKERERERESLGESGRSSWGRVYNFF